MTINLEISEAAGSFVLEQVESDRREIYSMFLYIKDNPDVGKYPGFPYQPSIRGVGHGDFWFTFVVTDDTVSIANVQRFTDPADITAF